MGPQRVRHGRATSIFTFCFTPLSPAFLASLRLGSPLVMLRLLASTGGDCSWSCTSCSEPATSFTCTSWHHPRFQTFLPHTEDFSTCSVILYILIPDSNTQCFHPMFVLLTTSLWKGLKHISFLLFVVHFKNLLLSSQLLSSYWIRLTNHYLALVS